MDCQTIERALTHPATFAERADGESETRWRARAVAQALALELTTQAQMLDREVWDVEELLAECEEGDSQHPSARLLREMAHSLRSSAQSMQRA